LPDQALAERHVREFARACVRAGLLDADALRDEVEQAIETELPHRADGAGDLAAAWIDEAREELRVDQESWPEATDYERLQSAFTEIELGDVVVLQGVEDHWAAKAVLDERHRLVHRVRRLARRRRGHARGEPVARLDRQRGAR
jgi:hypothetical protein